MIAQSIAYTMAALFVVMGTIGQAVFWIRSKSTATDFVMSMMLFALAWGCAYLGGI